LEFTSSGVTVAQMRGNWLVLNAIALAISLLRSSLRFAAATLSSLVIQTALGESA
jgi:hypothetical protein